MAPANLIRVRRPRPHDLIPPTRSETAGQRCGHVIWASSHTHLRHMAWNQEDARRTRLVDSKERARAKRQAQLGMMHERMVAHLQRRRTPRLRRLGSAVTSMQVKTSWSRSS